MKAAISTDGDFVSAHFGRCPQFTILEIENGKIVSREMMDNPGHEPGLIPKILNEKGVNCIIAGGMGARAEGLFAQYTINCIVGVSGKIEDTVSRLLAGTLAGGESLCSPGDGKGYGLDKTECTHGEQ